ncbi:MAG: PilZ domain-containing protein [Nitrospira sp.]|nr:PilZ domain-containing protein [Nitrospira sp.]
MKPRYSQRKATTCKVSLSSGGRVADASLLDLTVPGCQLETAFPLEPGQSVQLQVHLDGKRPMRIDLGVVRWARQGKAGIEFLRMAEADQLRLRFYVGHLEQRPRSRMPWDETPLCVGY